MTGASLAAEATLVLLLSGVRQHMPLYVGGSPSLVKGLLAREDEVPARDEVAEAEDLPFPLSDEVEVPAGAW